MLSNSIIFRVRSYANWGLWQQKKLKQKGPFGYGVSLSLKWPPARHFYQMQKALKAAITICKVRFLYLLSNLRGKELLFVLQTTSN